MGLCWNRIEYEINNGKSNLYMAKIYLLPFLISGIIICRVFIVLLFSAYPGYKIFPYSHYHLDKSIRLYIIR